MIIRNTENESKKKYNYVYKLYLKNDERYFYIGKRSTNNEDDSKYLGSGKALIKYKKQFGKDCFRKEILSYWDSSEKALKEEARLVTKELVEQEFCLNRIIGGGSFDTLGCKWGKRTKEQVEKVANKLRGKKQSEETKKKRSESLKRKWKDEKYIESQKNGRKGKFDKHLNNLAKERCGKICIIKNNTWKYINKEDFQKYENDGWKKRGVDNKPDYEQIMKYREQGFSYSKIGKIYGVGESTVRKWKKTYEKNN